FIFAVIAEELGLLGVSLILGFWAIFFYRLYKAAMMTRDNFSFYFILGVSALFFSQVMINIGMNIGLVPVTGVSLPFVSYGGSFLVVSLILVGLVESMIVRNKLGS
ncbi:MAG TPA: FtsW/RodA/SpoVE family cell cycle protein, partial [Patescibacteria group bacterium]|nr:FtsW/RodA/SpoVE family cell cycle protein [Patescibacteria group bacterium]